MIATDHCKKIRMNTFNKGKKNQFYKRLTKYFYIADKNAAQKLKTINYKIKNKKFNVSK